MKKILFAVIALSSQILLAQTQITNYASGKKQSEGAFVGTSSPITIAASNGETRVAPNQAKEGNWNYWYESGKPSAEENYTNGAPSNVWKNWFENGKQSAEINYDLKKAVYYFENGKKQSEGQIKADKSFDGKWTGWHDNGTKSYEGNYINGKKEGVWSWYDETGKLTSKQNYQADNLINTQKF